MRSARCDDDHWFPERWSSRARPVPILLEQDTHPIVVRVPRKRFLSALRFRMEQAPPLQLPQGFPVGGRVLLPFFFFASFQNRHNLHRPAGRGKAPKRGHRRIEKNGRLVGVSGGGRGNSLEKNKKKIAGRKWKRENESYEKVEGGKGKQKVCTPNSVHTDRRPLFYDNKNRS